LRVAVATKNGVEIVTRLGGAPQSIQLIDLYAALQRGGADGGMINWPSFPPFELNEVTSYHLQAPFGGSATMIFMAKKKMGRAAGGGAEDARRQCRRSGKPPFRGVLGHASNQGRCMTQAMGDNRARR